MKIIPAERSDAAWLVSNHLKNLLSFAIHPDPEALSAAWLDAIKERVVETTDAAQRSFEGDALACELLNSARKLAFQFAKLMHDRPKLSTIPVEEWNVESYRRLFDDLSAAERTIRTMTNRQEAQPEPEEPTPVGTTSGPSGQTQNNIPQPEDVAEFYRLRELKSFEGKSKAEIHRTIADSNAKKTGETLTDEERTREAERIKKAIRDYENKVARLK